ncbi:hypothetical protein CDD82_6021 [Ophiocordyceps australis]|uniref:Golgi apyrase n=1 Tax=Ophiocordyceps australis TaxID=1399860 RepID=A0A2C5YZM5_9HYPO|nr:hypothetical protein CDD82_6021 [Ophiocordyceps australis]
MGKHSQYGVILDAGSSGTRVYVYKWKHPASALKHASLSDMHRLPKLKLKKSAKIHPGISSYADNVAAVGSDHLDALLDVALAQVPASKMASTPIFLMATAGVRFLPQKQQDALLGAVCTYLRKNTRFYLPDCKSHVQVISGESEGLYGWIAANYLLGGFDQPEKHVHGKNHHTYGFLDMGGASAQIAFAPNSTEIDKHADDLKLVRLRRLDGSPLEYRVFTATWLGFGANKARSRYIEGLRAQYHDSVEEIPDPCLPRGLRTTLDGEPATEARSDQALVGTGVFGECLRNTYPLLSKDAPCKNRPCLLHGQDVPAIDFDVNRFVGVSEYWHTTHGVFGKEHNAYDLATYQHTVMEYCNRDWSSIESNLKKRKKTQEERAKDARQACFKASWLINMLHDGIGIPRVSLEGVPQPGINTTNEAIAKGQDGGFLDHFQPVDKINGIEVSWTLGKMALYAAGQIPPQESSQSLDVGFGSNVPSGIPSDFEHAGSSPLFTNEESQDDESTSFTASGPSVYSLLIFGLLMLLVAHLLRKPERRRQFLGMFGRQRRFGGSRKNRRRRAPWLMDKIFGRSHAPYERLTEEGETGDVELGRFDAELGDVLDSSGSSGPPSPTRLPTPKLNVEVSDHAGPPSVMDRKGLAVRTESRERLAPTLQMLNAGRRSRTGSPIRLKSPQMTTLRD